MLIDDFLRGNDSDPYRCNITGLQLNDNEPMLKVLLNMYFVRITILQTDTALIVDAIHLLGEAIADHWPQFRPQTESMLCDQNHLRWNDGRRLANHLKNVIMLIQIKQSIVD
jgi:hypothetical protein